jgi:hypothetical protein
VCIDRGWSVIAFNESKIEWNCCWLTNGFLFHILHGMLHIIYICRPTPCSRYEGYWYPNLNDWLLLTCHHCFILTMLTCSHHSLIVYLNMIKTDDGRQSWLFFWSLILRIQGESFHSITHNYSFSSKNSLSFTSRTYVCMYSTVNKCSIFLDRAAYVYRKDCTDRRYWQASMAF